ncbi:MAG TPA: ABC transporter substrate-binding protein [Thermodesulfobacteriota bacterium]|jgi:ABC-type branched-subunit amino acid transport system substrate-binding protein|nr:ABC transporter substrate-binding protein [Thermodesulfobacteriota bacterium]
MVKRNLVLIGLLIFTLFISAPASAQKVRGVTDTEILIGQTGPQTGPAAAWGSVARGSGLFFKGLNDEGGIHGRKIKYFLRDDSYQPAKTKAIANELVEQIGIFGVVGCVGVGPGMSVRDYYTENKVLMVSFGCSGVTNWINPFNKYIFPMYPLYIDEAYALTRYFFEQMKITKVAMFYQNDDYGKQGLEGVERYEKEKGLKLLASVSAEVTDRDLSSHALKLKNSGAEAVVMWAMPTHGALLLAECAKIGYKPQWGTSSTLSDGPLMLQITKGLWAGMIHSFFGELPDSDHPLMVKYRAWHKKYEPEERWGVFYWAGITFAEPLAEGLRRAGKNVTPESFIKAMETLKDWRQTGTPLTFTPTDHQGAKYTFFTQVQPDGTFKKLTDWIRITK